jgi:hypothetical protein
VVAAVKQGCSGQQRRVRLHQLGCIKIVNFSLSAAYMWRYV